MNKQVLSLLVMCMVSVPTLASAHHVVSEAGVAWVEPNSRVEVSMESASFEPLSTLVLPLTISNSYSPLVRLPASSRPIPCTLAPTVSQ